MQDNGPFETVPVPVAPLEPAAKASRKSTRTSGRRLHGSVAQKLGTAILSGTFQPGDTLSGEVAYSQALNISRSAYREAVQVLIAKGLVASRPKTGTRVLPRNRWNLLDPDVLSWAFAGEPDRQFVKDLFELRAIVEPAAAALAAQRCDRANLRTMSEALSLMRQHTLATEQGRAADRDFHSAILQATQNDALQVLASSIGAAVNWTTQFKQRSRELPRDPIPDHVAVYQAIADQDAAASAQAMSRLVQRALEDTAEALADS